MVIKIINLCLILSTLLSVLVGLKVLLNHKRKAFEVILSILVFAIAIWAWSLFELVSRSSEVASTISFLSVVLIIVCVFLIISTFSKNGITKKTLAVALLPSSLIIVLILIPHQIIFKFWIESGHINLIPGRFYWLFCLYAFIYIVLVVAYFRKVYKKIKGISKIQLKYIAAGFTIGAAFSLMTNLILPTLGFTQLDTMGPIFMLFLVGGIAYGLSKYILLGAQVMFAETLSIILILVVLVWLIMNYSLFNLIMFFSVIIISFLFMRSSIIEAHERLELEKKELKLEQDKVKLQELDQMKDDFIMMATHEISTPLTVVNAKLSMVYDENLGNVNTEGKDFLKPVYISSKRINELFRKIIEVVNIDSAKFALLLGETDIIELAKDSIESNRKAAAAKKIEIKTNFPNGLKKINIDKVKIKEVMDCFVNNAISFSEPNSKIKVTVFANHQMVKFNVEDEGAGINDDGKKHIFEKFYQSDRFNEEKPQEQQGSGLSLYIAKKIIKLHGGEIGFESTYGKGSNFYFLLPLNK